MGAPSYNDSDPYFELAGRVRANQQRLTAALQPQYDFIVCGSGSSGSVVARRLAENASVSVLLLEAGGPDDVPEVMRAEQWPANLGSERDWNFAAQPNPHLNGRAIPYSMGKVLGGGSSINVMAWARGHKNDWDYFAAEAGDKAWSYESVLNIYRRIEDWRGAPDPDYRGTGGPVYVQPAPDPNPIAPAALEGARSVGIPKFENQNGRMMEGEGGASILDVRVRDGYRQSVFRSYVFPYLDQPNLTVLTGALVTRVTFERNRADAVEFSQNGQIHRVGAGSEVVLSLGAIHTPKVLMQSGIGDQTDLQRHGIPVVQHLPGVGENLQDHPLFACVWEYQQPLAPRNNGAEATFFWKSDPRLDTPDLQIGQGEFPMSTPEPRPCLSDRPRPDRPGADRRKYVVASRRSEGGDSRRGTLPRDRQLRRTSTLHQARSHAGPPQGCRTRALHSGCRLDLLAPNLHRQDGPRPHVRGRRRSESLWDRTPSDRRRLDHAARYHRQHHGTLRHHRRTRSRHPKGPTHTLTSPRQRNRGTQ
jgi:choline dehydrogenase-like flavoprotein